MNVLFTFGLHREVREAFYSFGDLIERWTFSVSVRACLIHTGWKEPNKTAHNKTNAGTEFHSSACSSGGERERERERERNRVHERGGWANYCPHFLTHSLAQCHSRGNKKGFAHAFRCRPPPLFPPSFVSPCDKNEGAIENEAMSEQGRKKGREKKETNLPSMVCLTDLYLS
mmetsp:Transcript_46863/g.92528  ORF Transcript_46863/g.92528 Transcript_46863/m.92528 type:complete len:172 (+) Transcript_46863:338-853(+)